MHEVNRIRTYGSFSDRIEKGSHFLADVSGLSNAYDDYFAAAIADSFGQIQNPSINGAFKHR